MLPHGASWPVPLTHLFQQGAVVPRSGEDRHMKPPSTLCSPNNSWQLFAHLFQKGAAVAHVGRGQVAEAAQHSVVAGLLLVPVVHRCRVPLQAGLGRWLDGQGRAVLKSRHATKPGAESQAKQGSGLPLQADEVATCETRMHICLYGSQRSRPAGCHRRPLPHAPTAGQASGTPAQ